MTVDRVVCLEFLPFRFLSQGEIVLKHDKPSIIIADCVC